MKRIALSLIILALAVSARAETRPIAAGTPAGVVTLCGDDGDGNCTLGGAGLDVSGSTVDLGDIGPAATAALQGGGMPAALGAGGGIKSEGSQADGVAQTANPVVIGAKSVVDGQVETLFSQGGFLAQVPIGAVTEGSAIVNPVTAGGKDSGGLSRAIATTAAGEVKTTPIWCDTLAHTKVSTLTALTANTANQAVSAGCTGACAKVICTHTGAVVVLVRATNGDADYVPLGPYGSVEFTGAVGCDFSTAAPADITATPSGSVMACDD